MVVNWAVILLAGLPLIQEPYTLKLDVHIVSVDVTVPDDKDNLVNRLTKEDSAVYENGVPQEIRFGHRRCEASMVKHFRDFPRVQRKVEAPVPYSW
jgi:hypothetical protein